MDAEKERAMVSPIKRWLAPPVFEDDEDKTRTARILNAILLVELAVVVISTTSLPAAENPISGLVPIGIMAVLSLGSLIVMRFGYVRLAGWVFCSTMWMFTTGLLFMAGGVSSPMTMGHLVVATMASLLLSGHAAIVFAGLSVAAATGVFFLETRGSLPPAMIPNDPFSGLMALIGNIIMATALLYLASRSIANSLERARRNERNLTESNQELLGIRASLEERNQYLQDTVQRYDAYLANVGQGNLSNRLVLNKAETETDADDPLIALGHRLNDTVASLQGMATQVRETAGNLNSAATELLASTTQQAAGANEQSAAISQTTTTVDELRAIAEQSVVRAQTVMDASQRTVDVARTGKQAVQETIGSMTQITARVESIAENILALSEQTQQVGEIIATVNDIAAQSNILALNASVEAARAGEYGKGFAVVAVEVRNLAEQSRYATAQIKAILSDIQQATNATVMATEEGTKGVESGVRQAAQTGAAIEALAAVIDESAQAAVQMVAGGRQQASGVEQVSIAMQSINQATVQGLASTRQAETTARELSDLARRLAEVVQQYQL